MSDPKHPTKIVIVVRSGCVNAIFCDKDPGNLKILVADYDNIQYTEDVGVDWRGKRRSVTEETAVLDTAAVRNIINKRGGKCSCGRPQCGSCATAKEEAL